MNYNYIDIISRINENPKWWDEYAVPRYCEFSPNEVANIYAQEVAFCLIECQYCGTEFKVAFSRGLVAIAKGNSLEDSLRQDGFIHYGDPPNNNCCNAGPTMNSFPRKVIEFWSRMNNDKSWKRKEDLEGLIKANWDN